LSDNYSIVPPDPAGTIESLSALGYSVESAISDIVDNSIDAGAQRISVFFHWNASDSHVAVVDDGEGMDAEGLETAMALARRGRGIARDQGELGRFGMGLKTASFSQCTTLSVWSKNATSDASTRVWDLDEVVRSGEWRLRQVPDASVAETIGKYLGSDLVRESGTVVIWSGLRTLVDDSSVDDEEALRHFLEAIDRVDKHLGMTFSRFLTGTGKRSRVEMTINDSPVRAWDPFMTAHPATLSQPTETVDLEGELVRVRPYVLPPKSSLTQEEFDAAGGPLGWLNQQGFYVYRNDRLIVPGGWLDFRGFRQDEKHVLARVALDVPAELDREWSVDVKKATASPPLKLRGTLRRTAKATRETARNVIASRTRSNAITTTDELTFLWRTEKQDSTVRLRLNWGHPLVAAAMESARDDSSKVRALLRMLEETAPVGALRILFDPDQDKQYQPFMEAPEEVLTIGRRIYEAYISRGLTPPQARQRLITTPPFDEYPDLLIDLEI
jgi:hypothetical protein